MATIVGWSRGSPRPAATPAPCGFQIAYLTPIIFPSMAHYRWHSIFDHLDRGECQEVGKCGDAVTTGTV